ncbi:hypothetical protein ABH930_005452 [Kitasatospora sp. GAS204A]|uniref:DUF4129 domain-containing protein n=1 Tax=unclassified Kitasatospora TaxID=2633591 RepID=UPI002476DFCB|nr:DUF4129 domain-containing protein [Kitasatospora sp. GAS204B]MDH6121455.1 hypothetical protein [Kitasatospora sp. GAS204B]
MPTWGDWVTAVADGAPVTTPRDPAREAAREELLKPEYHRQDPSLLQRIISWLWDRLDQLLGQLGSAAGNGTTGLILFLVIAVLVGAALWWRLGRPGRAATSAAALFSAAGPRTAEQHRAAARRHAAEGDFAAAVREQMRALVRALEERALLDPRPGRTADEAAAEAGRQLPRHAAALREAARLFDDIAFGERAADRAAYQRLAELDDALRQTRPTAPIPAGAA